MDSVDAVAAGLVDHVARVVDHIGVVAFAAEHRVGALAAVEQVIAAKAHQHVRSGVAGQHIIER